MEAIFDGRLEQRIEVNPTPQRKRLAETMAAEAARVLGIPVPPVRFYYRGNTDTTFGYTDGTCIFIGADLDERMTCAVVVHECRHLWQDRDPVWRNRSKGACEIDARLFELEWPR